MKAKELRRGVVAFCGAISGEARGCKLLLGKEFATTRGVTTSTPYRKFRSDRSGFSSGLTPLSTTSCQC